MNTSLTALPFRAGSPETLNGFLFTFSFLKRKSKLLPARQKKQKESAGENPAKNKK